ncbi:helix-turn-helix domain-containing protein [Mesotoga prima]|jgi:transcriptional regulator with XRE-family HTH domain|uniref:helix-turn-helix domain-containing protein n=1 Tax=Mesotoga prima TaxID=1184387 RepID=UPI002FE1FE8E
MTDLDNIGEKLKSLREAHSINAKDLAEKAGVSTSMISQIEHGRVSPSLSTLKKILTAMDETIISLVQLDMRENTLKGLIKKDDRVKVIVAPGLYYEVLSTPNASYAMFLSYLSPGSGTEEFFIHEGLESGIIVQGKVELTVGDTVIIMEEGDSITHSSVVPHKWRNIGEDTVIGIWVVSPPSF